MVFVNTKHDMWLMSLLKAVSVEELPGNRDSNIPNERVLTPSRQFKDKWQQVEGAVNTS